LYFITKGFMRLFYYDDNGDEITTIIVSPNRFITSFLNFIHEKKSKENLECITDCQFYKIERSQLIELLDKNGKFTYHPSSSWGPYQIPFHLNQPIVVPSKGN